MTTAAISVATFARELRRCVTPTRAGNLRLSTAGRFQFRIPGVAPNKVIEFESDESGEFHRLLLFTAPLRKSGPKDPMK